MSAINTTARPIRIKWYPLNDGRNCRAHVNGYFGTVVSCRMGHFAYVSGGKLPKTRCASKLAAKRLVGSVLRS